MAERSNAQVAYRAVLLAAVLLVLGLLFQELVTLLLAVLITTIIAIPLAACATALERRGIPRPLGALIGLLSGVAVVAAVLALLIPPFVDETNQFADDVPGIVDDLRDQIHDVTGERPNEIADRVQDFVRDYTDDPEKLIGPITSIGLSVAGVLGALVLILITACYAAANPKPLIEGLLSLVPPPRRGQAERVMGRLRSAWIGWLQGVAVDMAVTFVLLYVALSLIGLDFALFFAFLTALLVVVPYFGAIAGAIPPTLLGLTESPGRGLLVLGVYILVQQIESNVTIPVVMSRTVRIHPAVIAFGVVVVGQLFGILGLFVAVPILSLIVISVEELWVKPLEASRGLELDGGDDHPRHHEDDDQDLQHDPEPRDLHAEKA
jgi:predicted PurR-regulated permease PerM